MRVMWGGLGVGFVHNPHAPITVIHRGSFSCVLLAFAGVSVRA